MFFNGFKGFKIYFGNRKWNYPNRKWNYFSHFHAFDQKTYFTKCFLFDPRNSKLVFKTGNGIISPTSRPPMKKGFLQHIFHLFQAFQNWFSKQETELSWNYFSDFQASDEKSSFTTYFSFVPGVSKLFFKNGNRIIKTGNGIIFPTSRPLIIRFTLQNVFHLFQRVHN